MKVKRFAYIFIGLIIIFSCSRDWNNPVGKLPEKSGNPLLHDGHNALLFNGNGDYVQIGPDARLKMTESMTVEAWIFATGPGSGGSGGGGIIINKEGEYEFARFADGTIQWAIANSSPGWGWINTEYVVPENQWVHLAFVYDADSIKTYVNSALVHSRAGSGVVGDVDPTRDDFRIGGRQVASQYFDGFIDEVRIWRVARTQSQIQGKMNETLEAEYYSTSERGLVGYWQFDSLEDLGINGDGVDDVRDFSVSENHGDLVGDVTLIPMNRVALLLNGNEDFVQVGSDNSLKLTDSLTIEAWISPRGQGSNSNSGGMVVNKEGEYEVWRYPNGSIGWALANSSPGWVAINTGYIVPENQWLHLAVVYDTDSIKTYVNSDLVHTIAGSGTIGDASPTQNDFRIGGRQGSSQYFDGFIDEVRIWRVARTQSQILAKMNDALGAEYYSTSDSGLVGYWQFDSLEDLGINGDGADDVRDFSVNRNHGDIFGDVTLISNGEN